MREGASFTGPMSHPLNMDKHFEGLFRFFSDPLCGLSNADKHLSGSATISIYGTRARARAKVKARCQPLVIGKSWQVWLGRQVAMGSSDWWE